MAFITLYNSKNPNIQQTIVFNVDKDDITSFEKEVDLPKPYFHFTTSLFNCSPEDDLPTLRNECVKRNLKKSGNKCDLLNRLLLDAMGIKQHVNKKFYQKIVPAKSYICTHRKIKVYTEDVSIDSDNNILDLNNINIINSVCESKLSNDSIWSTNTEFITRYPCLLWCTDNTLDHKVRDTEFLDKILIKYKVYDSEGAYHCKYNTLQGDSNYILSKGVWDFPLETKKYDLTWRNGNKYTGEIDIKKSLYGIVSYYMYYGLQGFPDHSGSSLATPSGNGKMLFKSGAIFIGEYKNGKKLQGKFTYKEDSRKLYYEGTYQDDIPSGEGYLVFKNGDEYKGQFKNGKYSGTGSYISKNYTYKGSYVNGLKDGIGVINYQDGTIYNGYWYRDMMDGKGILTYSNVKKDSDIKNYEGNFYENQYEGFGTLTFNNDEKYEGDFKGSVFNGNGTFTYKDMSTYKGHWDKGFRCGNGKIIYNNGNYYVGEWTNDCIQGRGKAVIINGCDEFIKSLEWNERRHDKDTLQNMFTIEGEWNNYKLNMNDIIITLSNKDTFHGEIDMEILPHEDIFHLQHIKINIIKGYITYNSGIKYIGEFSNNNPIGEYKLLLTDGSQLYGTRDKLNNECDLDTFHGCNGTKISGTFNIEVDKMCNGKIDIKFTGDGKLAIDSKKNQVELISKESIISNLICPITSEIMTEPVFCLIDGYTYEKVAIERWISDKGTSPFTRSKVTMKDLVFNRNIKDLVELCNKNK